VASGEELRALMHRFPTGVAVVTVDAAGERLGLTVGTLLSLSLEPPLVGVSISRQAALHELLRDAGAFAASLLAAGQEALAQHFARGVPPIALWHGIPVHPGPETGAPLLDGALGWVECRLAAEHTAGDHTLFVGEVVSTALGTNAAPLVHLGGGYAAP
jgi:flavin reductase (DIM6/NTAB) family NADH-FMN oxidoreductase RutF